MKPVEGAGTGRFHAGLFDLGNHSHSHSHTRTHNHTLKICEQEQQNKEINNMSAYMILIVGTQIVR
jgi:hypothetical protein